MSLQDPFFVVKEEVRQEVATMEGLFARWKDLLETTVTSTNEEFDWVQQELRSSLKSIEYDLQDLDETIAIVEGNRTKFHIEDEEIGRRRQFVTEMRRTVDETKDTLQHPRTLGKLEADRRTMLMGGASSAKGGAVEGGVAPSGKYARLDEDKERDNEGYLESEGTRRQALMEKQDQDLDVLHDGVQRLGQIGITINDELATHGELLDALDDDVSHTKGNLKRAQIKVKKLLKNTDKGSICVIVGLIIALVVLVSIFFS